MRLTSYALLDLMQAEFLEVYSIHTSNIIKLYHTSSLTQLFPSKPNKTMSIFTGY